MNKQFLKKFMIKFKEAFSPSFLLIITLFLTFSCSNGGNSSEINYDQEPLNITEVVIYNNNGAKVETTNAIPVSKVSLLVTFSNSDLLSGVSDVSGWTSHITLNSGGNDVPITITKVENNQIRVIPQNDLRHGTTYTLTIKAGLMVENYRIKETYTRTFTTVKSSDTSLRVTYRGATHQIGNIHTIIFTNEETRTNTGIEVILTVAEGATLSNDSRLLPLTDNSYTTNLAFSNSNATHTFTVTAQDEMTTKLYTIESLIVKSNTKQIIAFSFDKASNSSSLVGDVFLTIDEVAKTITDSITNASTRLVPTIQIAGSSISPASGVVQNFSTNNTYTVTAYDGSKTNYTVSVAHYYEVTFNTNGGQIIGDPPYVVVVSNGETVTNIPSDPTQQHYGFTGWFTNQTGGNEFNTNIPITQKTTLYAQWTNKRYIVEFYINGNLTHTTSVDSLSRIPDNAYPTGNSIPDIWYIDTQYNTPYGANDLVTNNIKLYGFEKNLAGIIAMRKVPNSFNGYDKLSKTIFSNYTARAKVTARYVKTNGSGDGSSWTNATSDLQGAINSISDASATNIYVVLVASGNYKPGASYSMKNHVAIVGGFTADTYNRAGETQLDGNGARRVFNNNGLDKSATLYGLTITNGKTDFGGGMYNYASSPILMEVTFSGNTANLGGGMYNSSSSPTLAEVIFFSNTSTRQEDWTLGDGGGMYNTNSSPTLTKVIFSNNRAVGGVGGGGMANFNSAPTLTGVTFFSNRASFGGGMFNIISSSSILTGVTFSGNMASSFGGGMANFNSAPTLTGVTFSGNTAGSGGGGGMYNSSSPTQPSSPILIGVTFSENTAGSGGGMFNTSSSPILIGVTFSGNTASGWGGGIHNVSASQDSIDISFLTLINTLMWGNNKGNIYLDNSRPNQNLNLYYSLVEGGVTPSTNATGIRLEKSDTTANPINIQSYSVITANPNLQELADNGGEVLTHALPSGSSAKDAGAYVRGVKNRYRAENIYYSTNNTAWYRASDGAPAPPPGDADNFTATDARGYGRVGRPDIGAYEVGGSP